MWAERQDQKCILGHLRTRSTNSTKNAALFFMSAVQCQNNTSTQHLVGYFGYGSSQSLSSKGKGCHWIISREISPFHRAWAPRWLDHQSLQCMASVMPDLQLSSKLHSITTYILFGDKDITLYRVIKQMHPDHSRTYDLLIACPTQCATMHWYSNQFKTPQNSQTIQNCYWYCKSVVQWSNKNKFVLAKTGKYKYNYMKMKYK